ncbi:helix-loop-helix DNA-binding domain-containing protein [Lipomyces arxii]|uniref:helix-loop-helix DNA-binding domain-containing protein n=1 Tax=Lipomyces arxii TaxID=56418 RepID=UPI0034CEFAA9
MSYTSSTYIKPDPDAFYNSGMSGFAQSNGNPDLMSREMLTRGFSSFDDSNLTSSMIPEADLLDFEGLGNNGQLGYGGDVSATGMDGALSEAANIPTNLNGGGQSSYFSPSSHNQINSGSPFDDFMTQRPIPQKMNGSPRPLRPESHTQKFLYNNDYIPKQQSNLQSVSVPEASSWGTPPGSFDQSYASPPRVKGLGSSLPQGDPDKNQLLMMEKRRRRRESHNAVERRRRDNINEKIQELALLIPEHIFAGTGLTHSGSASGVNSGSVGTEDSTPGVNAGTPLGLSAALGKDGKPNKGIILRKSVDYIRQLQMTLEQHERRNQELEMKVQQLQQQQGIIPQNPESTQRYATEFQQRGQSKMSFETTPNSNNSNNNDDFADFEYDDNVFPTSPQQISDLGRGYNGMDMS